MFQAQKRETINSTLKVAVSFKIIMTMRVTRSCFTKQRQNCKTKTKTDFLVSDRPCPKTDGLRPHHCCFLPARRSASAVFATATCPSVTAGIGLSHARPNSGISGDLLSENEANPVVIWCSGGGCYSLVHTVINFAVVNWWRMFQLVEEASWLLRTKTLAICRTSQSTRIW